MLSSGHGVAITHRNSLTVTMVTSMRWSRKNELTLQLAMLGITWTQWGYKGVFHEGWRGIPGGTCGEWVGLG